MELAIKNRETKHNVKGIKVLYCVNKCGVRLQIKMPFVSDGSMLPEKVISKPKLTLSCRNCFRLLMASLALAK